MGVVLALGATVLVRLEIRKHVQLHGQPALEELFQFTVERRVPVYV